MEQQGIDFATSHARKSDPLTSKDAARKAEINSMSIKNKIIQRLSDEPLTGLTPDEFNEEVDGLINTIRRRFTDLWKEGKIRHHPNGLTRINSAKNECVAWVIGEDENRKPSRVQVMKNEIYRLRKLLMANKIDPDQND